MGAPSGLARQGSRIEVPELLARAERATVLLTVVRVAEPRAHPACTDVPALACGAWARGTAARFRPIPPPDHLGHRTGTRDLGRPDAPREHDLVAERILRPHDQRAGFAGCHLVVSSLEVPDEHRLVVGNDEVHRYQGWSSASPELA